jgi:hypothetical protein
MSNFLEAVSKMVILRASAASREVFFKKTAEKFSTGSNSNGPARFLRWVLAIFVLGIGI